VAGIAAPKFVGYFVVIAEILSLQLITLFTMRKIHESPQMEVFSLDFEGIDTVETPLYINAVQAGFPLLLISER
jgi:hypothetical protein